MKKLTAKDLDFVIGGTTISGTLINSFTNIVKVLMDAGRSVGSSIRRISENKVCSLE